jgi:hypothetical protein
MIIAAGELEGERVGVNDGVLQPRYYILLE